MKEVDAAMRQFEKLIEMGAPDIDPEKLQYLKVEEHELVLII